MPVFNQLLQSVTPHLETYVLVLVRVGFIFMVAPVFGSRIIPKLLKAAMVIVVAFGVFPAASAGAPPPVAGMGWAVSAVAGEAVVGLMVGIAARVLFFSIQLAGFIAGFQMGFLIASAIDPQEGRNTPLIAQFQEILALLIFLAMDGHLWVLKGLAASYQMVPVFKASWSGGVTGSFVNLTGQIFVVALKIAAPIMVPLLMTNFGLGILARTVPQMNIFVVSMPVNIAVGMFALALSLQVMVMTVEGGLQAMGEQIAQLLAGFR